MKRKTSEPDEGAQETEKVTGKRMRIERTVRGGRGKHARTYSAGRKSVGPELLEDMGVNLIEDASNDSTASTEAGAGLSCTTQHSNLTKSGNINLVLKDRDINIRTSQNQSSDNSMSGMKIPQTKQIILEQTSLASSQRDNLLIDRIPSDLFLAYNRQRPQDIQPKVDNFSRMSDEIVLLVFKWLPKCSLARCAAVCRRWRRLVKDESLWKRIELGMKSVRPGVLEDVVSRGCVVLRLARSTISSPVFIQEFSSQYRCKLQYLDLSMATIESNCLATLIKTCKNLKKLALEHCDLSNSVCDGIGENKNIEVLHLAMVTGLTPMGLKNILVECSRLRELNISWTDLTLQGIQVLTENVPGSIDRLCLAGYRDILQDDHIKNICSRCPNLIELDVSDAAQLTAETISIVVHHCLRLESLSTSRCYGISPYSYLLLKKLHTLLCLNIYGLLGSAALDEIKSALEGVEVNQYPLSSVARPTIGIKRTSIWNLRVRD